MINKQELIGLLEDVLYDGIELDTFSRKELYNRLEEAVDELKKEDILLTEAGLNPEVEQCPA